jgi:membrane-anchored protein YejM (alkaline phosphatase superfamily)
VGRNLFSGEPWRWMMAGSYTDHAIVEPGRVIVSHPGGFIEVRDDAYRPVDGAKLDPRLIQESLAAQRRFLQ